MPEWLTIVLTIVTVLAAGGLGFGVGWDRGRNRGRMEVLDRWFEADDARAERQARRADATFDEIVRRNPTGGIVPPFITDRIPGHETDQP